jgi:hypothetical protein
VQEAHLPSAWRACLEVHEEEDLYWLVRRSGRIRGRLTAGVVGIILRVPNLLYPVQIMKMAQHKYSTSWTRM